MHIYNALGHFIVISIEVSSMRGKYIRRFRKLHGTIAKLPLCLTILVLIEHNVAIIFNKAAFCERSIQGTERILIGSVSLRHW